MKKAMRETTEPALIVAGPDFKLLPAIKTFPQVIGALLVLFYLLPHTALAVYASSMIAMIALYGIPALLIICFLYIISKSLGIISFAGIALLAMTMPSALNSSDFAQAFFNWAGWALLVVVVGPVMLGGKARLLRETAWETYRLVIIAISVLSLLWYVLSLPTLVKGLFTGVTMHSMVLGPISAIAFLVCGHYAIVKKSKIYFFLAIIFIPPCLLAGSRAALLALFAGLIVLIGIYLHRSGYGKSTLKFSFIIFLLFVGFALSENYEGSGLLSRYADTLMNKGLQNTREHLWVARWQEFGSNPLFGVGIGMGEGAGVEKDASGNINVEPGSSYLALLAMTGLLGLAGFVSIIAVTYQSVRKYRRNYGYDPALAEVMILLAFLFVNMAAEGWILAAGSPFCLLFWLCFGRIRDLEFNGRLQHRHVS